MAAKYKEIAKNKDTNNIFAFFIEKAISLGRFVSIIVPKSLINSPEFNVTREVMSQYAIKNIIDFGEKGFKGVKIETISFTRDTCSKQAYTTVLSYINNSLRKVSQAYITDKSFPYWLLYRDENFDSVANRELA